MYGVLGDFRRDFSTHLEDLYLIVSHKVQPVFFGQTSYSKRAGELVGESELTERWDSIATTVQCTVTTKMSNLSVCGNRST